MTFYEREELNNTKVIFRGVEMTYKEREAIKRKEKKEKEVKDKNARVIPLLMPRIEATIKTFKLSKSIAAFYTNGYKQWGVITYTITRNPLYKDYFEAFIAAYIKANDVLKRIKTLSKRNDKDIFGFIERIAYSIDDMGTSISNLANAMSKNRLFDDPTYAGKEIMFGSSDGRRLGIKELISRTTTGLIACDKAYKELIHIVNSGEDVMAYDANSKKTITFVQG